MIPAKSAEETTRTKVRGRLESRTIALLNDARNVEVGNRIREARRYAGLSQAALARVMNPPVTEKAVQQWENGTFAADANRLKAIAKATKIPGGWLWLYGSVTQPLEPEANLKKEVAELRAEVAELRAALARFLADAQDGPSLGEGNGG